MLIDIKFDGEREDGETYAASGQYDTEKNELTIRQGSRWTPTVTQKDKGARRWIEPIRKKLVDDGIVDEDTDEYLENMLPGYQSKHKAIEENSRITYIDDLDRDLY